MTKVKNTSKKFFFKLFKVDFIINLNVSKLATLTVYCMINYFLDSERSDE